MKPLSVDVEYAFGGVSSSCQITNVNDADSSVENLLWQLVEMRAVVQEVESISLDCFKIVRVAHGQYLDSPPREGRDKIPELQRILVNRVAIDCGNDASFPLHRSILFRLIYKIIFRSLDDADDPLRSMLWNEVLRKCERSIWLVKGLFAGREHVLLWNENGVDSTELLRQQCTARMKKIFDQLDKAVNSKCRKRDAGVGLYVGSSGLGYAAQCLHTLADALSPSEGEKPFMDTNSFFLSDEYISKMARMESMMSDEALSIVQLNIRRHRRERVSFLEGTPGAFAMAMSYCKENDQRQKLFGCILDRYDLVKDLSSSENEVLYGRAGYLHCLLWVRLHHGFIFRAEERRRKTPLQVMAEICEHLLLSGAHTALAAGVDSPLMYHWHNSFYMGAIHGLSGIMWMLMKSIQLLSGEWEPDSSCWERFPTLTEELKTKSKIIGSLKFLVRLQTSSGNFPSSVREIDEFGQPVIGRDRLVQLCHGATGVILTLLEGSHMYPEHRTWLLKSALRGGECVWWRGILRKGNGLCHGTSGSAYALLELFRTTGDSLWLRRANAFAQTMATELFRPKSAPDRPLSLFEGCAGELCFYTALLHAHLSVSEPGGRCCSLNREPFTFPVG